jgi:hypothetical protein
MRAAIYTKFGSPEVLQIKEIKKPKNPILGLFLAGDNEAIGDDVIKFKFGYKIYGSAKSGVWE